MSEKLARQKQYEYRSNSNLVLQAEREGPRLNEPTGEPETLWGKIGVARMGDKAQVRQRDQELEDKLSKMRKKQHEKSKAEEPQFKKQKLSAKSVLQAEEGGGYYKPKTKETKAAYEALLNIIAGALGDQPQDIIKGAADEVLALLKSEHIKAPEKKKEVEKLINSISESKFTDLVQISSRISDYKDESQMEGGVEGIDDEFGVAVVFDEEEDEEEQGSDYEVKEESEEEEDGKEETQMLETLAKGEEEDEMETEDQFDLDPKELVKPFWLKGKISELVDPDPINSQKLANKIMNILEESDERECEHQLVELLAFDKFDFIQTLLKNRLKIIWCSKIAHAETEDEREKIESEMKKDEELAPIIDALHKAGSKSKTLEKTIRKEARSIKLKEKGAVGRAEGRTIIDLESISFAQGSHFMANKQCKLPPGSFRKQKKGVEEVHVPALKAPPLEEGEALIHIEEMPDWAHKAFSGMRSLNRIQSRVYPAAFKSHENLLICAPTGAGKTNIAMLCILRELGLNMNSQGELDLENFKIVYIAPMKALVQETVGNFTKRLTDYGINVRELTGDMNLSKQQIKETQIIVTTPEKWDILTRKAGDRAFTESVKLIIMDEIHLLHDDRGPVLESIIARTIRQIETTQEMVRLVGLSATLPNYEDVATLLRVNTDSGLFAFNNSYRPCPLEQQYIGITEKKAIKRFQLMNEVTYEKVMEQAGKNQMLIFVHSRKETAKTARALRDMALQNDALGKILTSGASREILQTEAEESVKNPDLKEIMPYGFGIHHAGLTRTDRTLVEELFADGHIQILVSTATLAWGVNLPAHSVIIKGTQVYNPEKGRWAELSPMDVMQMLGRAGRPAFDTYGEGIIITSHSELQFYLSLLNQQLPIESQLIAKLADVLNGEIVLGTITNVNEAANWLGYTYLYVRMLRNPSLYGISIDEQERDPLLETRRKDLIHTAATILDKANLIKYDRRTGNFQITDLGVVASHYYVSHSSMSLYNEHLKANMGDIEIFRLFSLSGEFKYMRAREEEVPELEKLLDKVPVPVNENIEEASAKVNVLLQAYIARLKLDGFALASDMVYVQQSASRLMRALFEIVLKRGWAQLSEKILSLAKMVDRRMWGSQSPLRQFKDIPEDIVKKLEKKDFPYERLYDLNPQELGELISFPTMGKNLHKRIRQLPKLELTAAVQPITRSMLKVDLTITPDFQFDEKYHGNAEPFWILVQDVDQEKILHYEFFILKKKFSEEEHYVSFFVPLLEPLHPQYFIRIVSDRWLGSEVTLPVSFKHLILPEKFPLHTELLDLKPHPVSELKNPAFEALYQGKFKTFNPIQTQVFSAFYGGDANTLLCAPTGSGKSVCADLALMRQFSKNENAKCVYIGPLAAIASEHFKYLQSTFGQLLGKKVVEFTGETAHDLKQLEKGHIIVSTPENWDLISRRWKQRKAVQNVSLFIVDEMHLLGGDSGPALEVILSRMRYIAKQTGNKIRIVGLAHSVANFRDIAEWIAAPSTNAFNFHPNSRPVPLEIHIQGFDNPHFGARLLSMTRPTLYSVASRGAGKPSIVFVPNRKAARRITTDLIHFSDPQVPNKAFLKVTQEDLAPFLDRIQNKALKEALTCGIGVYHESLTHSEKRTVEHLFNSGAIQVLVATESMCWGMSMTAHLVIVMGTQFYDGREHRYSDYPIANILQMMGRACRTQQEDEIGKCVLYCFGPKKEFYKKFLYEPLPIESHLDTALADHMNAEIVTKAIENKQDAVDYLTWTFMYKRLTQNPNYYNLAGVSHGHISDHLSELIEQTLGELEQAKCLAIEDEMDLSPLNLGMIACYYNIKYTTIELFKNSLNAKTKLKGLIEILSSAFEFESIPIRQGEEKVLRKMAMHLPIKIEKINYSSFQTKVNILLQAHFSRRAVSADMAQDQNFILENSVRLLQAMVDVISSNRWLNPALATMELSQMITQAVWDSDSIMRQVPHFTPEIIEKCKSKGVESVFDLMELEDEDRNKILKGLSSKDIQDVVKFCNRYPNIDVAHEIATKVSKSGEKVVMNIQLEREAEEEPGSVYASYFPKEKVEEWWLVVGEPDKNTLLTVKRMTVPKKSQVKLEFIAPEPGDHKLKLYFMADSFNGCDQEYEIDLHVEPGADTMDE